MRVLIIAEPFPGLTAHQTCDILAAHYPNDDITQVPITRGGFGTSNCFHGQRITLPTVDPNGRLTEATYTFDNTTAQAYIDLPDTPCDATRADTYGTGVLIADAITRGANRIILATADAQTRDGGTGILIALGAQPHNAEGLPVPQGQQGLAQITSIDTALLNIPAASAQWVLLTDGAPQPADERFAAFCDAPEGIGIGLSLHWLTNLMHGTSEQLHILPATHTIMEALGVRDLVDSAEKIVVATTADSPTLGILAEYGANNITSIIVGPGEELASKLTEL